MRSPPTGNGGTPRCDRLYQPSGKPLPTQASLIGAVVELHRAPRRRGRHRRAACLAICSSCGVPANLKSYQVEYGYSVMGYEIGGGWAPRWPTPAARSFVMSGDASFLMMNSELATAIQEGIKITLSSSTTTASPASATSLSRSAVKASAATTASAARTTDTPAEYSTTTWPRSAKAWAPRCSACLEPRRIQAGAAEGAGRGDQHRIVVETDWHERVPGYSTCWWDMATAEVSEMPGVQEARRDYVENKQSQRWLSTLAAESAAR